MANVGGAEANAATAARKLFGTDGVRGTANVEPVTCEIALRLGRAAAQLCAAAPTPRRFVVGKDTRRSSDMLESAVAAGICSAGADVVLAGVLPTPGIALLTRQLGAAGGVVISASHNAFQDNGIKLFGFTGFKLTDEIEAAIERLVLEDGSGARLPTGADVGTVQVLDDATARYAESLRRTLPGGCSLRGLKIVIDCAHGAAYRVAPEVFASLGAVVVAIGAHPDGVNINRDAGALHPRQLQETVLATQAHLGLALDGDADRAMLVDERGAVVDGDEVLALAAADMLAHGTLRGNTVVATVMSNIGLEIALRERDARLVRVPVGDRYVVEEMVRGGYNLGGEQSGHLLVLDHSTTGDGVLAGLTVARLMIEGQRPLSELKRVMAKYPQALVNVRVARREDLDAVPTVRRVIEQVSERLHNRGRVLVRYSGTEPLVRVMVEGEDADQVRADAEEIAAALRAHLGA